MKTLKLIVLAMGLFIAGSSHAQVSVNVNIGSPPMWGPVGYADVQYYYLPDVYAYYDIHSSMFIYQSGGVWVHRTYLPSRYRNYDLYNGYKVVMSDYHGSRPYYHHSDYKRRYARGYHGPAQHNIGARPEHGYSGTRGDMNGRPNKDMEMLKATDMEIIKAWGMKINRISLMGKESLKGKEKVMGTATIKVMAGDNN
jgi:hypothetical protein